MKRAFVLAAFIFGFFGCAHSPVPGGTGVAIHPQPKEPDLIGSDLLPELERGFALPPAPGSAAQAEDEAELRDRQAKRTAADCDRANREVYVSLAGLFGKPLGPLDADEIPPLEGFFAKIRNDADYYIQRLKKKFPRPRPFAYLSDLSPCVPREVTGAYPSGHATLSRLYALILSDLFPARKKAFFARADAVAADRVLAGVHHPTDIRAGKELGARIYRQLGRSAKFRALFAESRKTLTK